jgi:hypothetical protein
MMLGFGSDWRIVKSGESSSESDEGNVSNE